MINNSANSNDRLNGQKMLAVLQIPVAFLLLVMSGFAFADYTFPGALPPGCSGSGGSYTCGSLTANTHYHFNDSGNVSVTVNGTLSINNYTIGDAGDSANVTFNVNGDVYITSPTIYANINANSDNINVNGSPSIYGDLRTSTGNITMRGGMQGNIITERGDITVNANSTITGDVAITGSTTTAYLNIYQDCVINGYVSAKTATTSDDIEIMIYERTVINGGVYALGQDYTDVILGMDVVVNGDVIAYGDDHSDADLEDRARVNGNVTSISVDNDDGIVSVKPNASVSGYVTSYGDINNQGAIDGCTWYSNNSSATIEHYSGSSNAGGSCCGSNRNSCSSSCIVNNSGSSISLCGPVETITVNAYGTDYFGSWPVMELWIDEVRVDSVMVDSGSAKNYVFKVDLPSSGSYKIDLVFPNDAWDYASEDRNLRINSINYDGNTVLSSDGSVVRDYGNDSATYFDGVNTQGPGSDLNSAGAMRFSHNVAAELIAEFHMDETSWSGSTSDLIDTAGYTGGPFNGQGIGSPIPTPAVSSPARAGSTGTCGYATFSGPRDGGSAFSIPNLPVNTSNGANTSASFWMYWDGTDYLMPLGWYRYDLWFVNGWFGFNTDNSDNYGTSASGLANGWHHIVAVFHNGDVTKSKLYIDGVLQSLSSYNSHDNNNAVVQPTLQVTGYAKDHNFRFPGGRIDELKVYRGELTTTQVSDDYNATHACNNSFKLLEYRMDEASWDGTTGEVIDSSGLNLHGTAAIKSGSTYPTTAYSSPAISGSTGTCGYGTFNGQQYIDVSSSFLNMTDGYTISTWIKPTNVSALGQRIFADDQNNSGGYSLSLSDGGGQEGKLNFFKRNDSGGHSIMFSNYALQNDLWYYIAASVSTVNNQVTLYIYNQAGSLLEKKTATFDHLSFSDSGTVSIANENVASSESKGFYGDLDELQVHLGSRPLYQSEIEALMNVSRSCPSYVVSVDAHDFNCIAEQETSPNTGHLYMQVAGQPFNIKVVALKSDGTTETDFSAASDKTVTLEFLDQTQSSTPITFNDGSNITSKSLTFTTSNTTGVVTVSNLNISNAYRNLRCRVTDTNQTPTLAATSYDNFSVRPLAFTLSSSANADSSGTNASALPTIVAGNAFTIYANTNTPGYNGTPQFDTSSNKRNAHAGASKKGTLTGTFSPANNTTGNSIGSDFIYDEVGYIKINTTGVYDSTFSAIDSANGDCIDDGSSSATNYSNNKSNGKYGCRLRNDSESAFFGRFIPSHFDVGGGSRVAVNACDNSGSDDFTYLGQDGLNTTFTIYAKNLLDQRTQNYEGAYATLDLNTWNTTSSTTGLRFMSTNLPAGVTLNASTSTPTSGYWDRGLGYVDATHQLSRPASPIAPFSLELGIDPVDSDGVSAETTPLNVLKAVDNQFRYGRLSLTNAHGSELLPLFVPIEAQYWDGVTYRKNTLDNCSTIQAVNVTMNGYQNNLTACETALTSTSTMSAGKITLQLSAPGNGNNGSVTLTPNITTPSGNTCVPNSTTATQSSANWFGTLNPAAKATFGLNKNPVIYMRENY